MTAGSDIPRGFHGKHLNIVSSYSFGSPSPVCTVCSLAQVIYSCNEILIHTENY